MACERRAPFFSPRRNMWKKTTTAWFRKVTGLLQWLSRARHGDPLARCGWPAISMAKTWKPELTSPNLQLRHLASSSFEISSLPKSPKLSPEISRCFQTCFIIFRHPRCRAEECGHSKGNWSPLRISPSQVVDVGVKKPQQHPPAIVQSLSHSEYSISYIFFRVSKGAARTLTQTGLKLRSRRHFTWGFLEHSNKNFRSCTLAVHN